MGSVGDVLAQCVQEMGTVDLLWCGQGLCTKLHTLCVSGLCLHCIPLVWCAGIQNVHSSKLFDVSLEYDIRSFNMNQGIH